MTEVFIVILAYSLACVIALTSKSSLIALKKTVEKIRNVIEGKVRHE